MHSGGMKTKLLAELMHHMISLHGKSDMPKAHEAHASLAAELPRADGSSKHSELGEKGGLISAKEEHEEPEMETDHEEHVPSLGDIFGRKGGKKEFF